LPAVAQNQDGLRDMRSLYDTLTTPGQVTPENQAEAMLAQLENWIPKPDELHGEDRIKRHVVEIYAALAVGHATRAQEQLAELQKVAADKPETYQAAYMVAMAIGDAKLGEEAVKALSEKADREERRELSIRRRWLRHMSELAPDETVVAEDGTKFALRGRFGVVLVVDFWNTKDTTRVYAEELRTLRDLNKSNFRVQFLGINADDENELSKAQEFAKSADWSYPQHYEKSSRRPPLTYGQFKAGNPPWTVIIDKDGKVQTVGSVEEPAFVYALRCAAAAASDKFVKKEEPGAGEQYVGKYDLPSNPEAAALLRQARTYLRTGMKTKAKELLEQIIRDYPGTREARDAQERLGGLP